MRLVVRGRSLAAREVLVGVAENQLPKQRPAVTTAAGESSSVSVTWLVWVAFALGLASAIPGMVLGLFGVPLGVAAAAVSAIALMRVTSKPPEQRRGELLTLLSLGFGVFQVVFALVAFYFVNLS
jgi:hypothetical protein